MGEWGGVDRVDSGAQWMSGLSQTHTCMCAQEIWTSILGFEIRNIFRCSLCLPLYLGKAWSSLRHYFAY